MGVKSKTIDGIFVGQMLRDWEESQHPRGKGGKFAKKGTAPVAKSQPEAKSQENSSAEPVKQNPAPVHAAKPKRAYSPKDFAPTDAKQFYNTFHAAKDALDPANTWRVDGTYSTEDYKGMKCFTTKGGSAVAVHDGDIVSVCRKPGDEVSGSSLLTHARTQGGDRLDAFSGLYGFYAKNGFEPVSYCAFDIEYKPDDWREGIDPQEPVIFFRYTGASYDDICKRCGTDSRDFTSRVKASADYFEAKAVRDAKMK